MVFSNREVCNQVFSSDRREISDIADSEYSEDGDAARVGDVTPAGGDIGINVGEGSDASGIAEVHISCRHGLMGGAVVNICCLRAQAEVLLATEFPSW